VPAQLEDLLSEGMQRRAAGIRIRPGTAQRAYRAYRWRRGAVRAAATVPAAAAIAVAVLVSGTTAPHAGRGSQGTTRTVSYVLSRVSKALGAQGPNLVEYSIGSAQTHPSFTHGHPDDVGVAWAYRDRSWGESFSATGRPTYETSEVVAHGRDIVVWVDYIDRTWVRNVFPSDRPADPCRQLFQGLGQGININYRASIDKALRCGTYVLAGHQRVDGQPTLKIASSAIAGSPGTGTTVWVNSATYLPVRVTVAILGHQIQANDISWLPPTPANLAHLAPPRIPAGFGQIHPHRLGHRPVG
jgi:hypothetical protein